MEEPGWAAHRSLLLGILAAISETPEVGCARARAFWMLESGVLVVGGKDASTFLEPLKSKKTSLIQKPREAHGNTDLCQSLSRFSQSGSGCGSNAYDPAQNLLMS